GRGLGAYRGVVGGAGGRAGSRAAGAGERIRVSEVATVAEAQLLCGEVVATLDHWPGAEALLRESWRERALGDFWGFCLVAEGAADAMFDGVDLHPWDVAALIPIVEEAGGRLTDIEGRSSAEAGPRIATNGHLHDELLRRLPG
ncbi:MAG: histidinol-phosphatase, partial [Chloroflexi bacterium]|nr:histidinol-phosphatase [Chloroflexota bacterium]